MKCFDARKLFISKNIKAYFNLPDLDFTRLYNHSCLGIFLDNSNVKLLLAAVSTGNDILLWNEVQDLDLHKKALAFVKAVPEPLTDANIMTSVFIISVQGSVAHMFYSVIDSFYAPLLMKCEGKTMHQYPRLQLALTDLVSGLACFSKPHAANNNEEPAHSVIFDIASEANYWQQRSRSNQNIRSFERQYAEKVCKMLKHAADETQRLQLQAPSAIQEDEHSGPAPDGDSERFLGSLSDTLEAAVVDGLDDVWRLIDDKLPPYPEPRMRSLLEAIAGWICRTLLSYLDPLKKKSGVAAVWKGPFKQVKMRLERSIQICEQWEKSCCFLTQQLWVREETHRWDGAAPTLTYLQQFKNRLSQVLRLRMTYEQLYLALSPEEREQSGFGGSMNFFLGKGLQHTGKEGDGEEQDEEQEEECVFSQLASNPLAFNPYNADMWFAAISLFDSRIQVAEELAVPHLRAILTSLAQKSLTNNSSSRVVFLELERFSEIFRRPKIASALQAEREMFMGYHEAGIKALGEEFSNRPSEKTEDTLSDNLHHGRNIPKQVDRIIWAGQLEGKAAEHLKLAEALLFDLSGFPDLKRKIESLIQKISTWRKEQFDNWCRSSQASVDDKNGPDSEDLSFDASKCLLHLSTTDGRLQVGYPDGLVRLQREVRLLAGFGYPVPAKLHKVAAQAEAMYRHAIVLKQVAHFYNSIDSQMIPCQQALMLKSAMAFENLIKFSRPKEPGDEKHSRDYRGGITWSQVKEVPTFIAKLQTAARNLMEENRKLRKMHYELIAKIVSLMDVDLLRQQSKWRETLMTMRCRLAEIASACSYPADHMAPWRAHLDRQLYKALEVQYRLGLEALSERMPEMRVELVYQQSRLAFQPPFEEIKSKYYREMRKFIGIPSHFRGVRESLDSSSHNYEQSNLIFRLIIENQSAGFQVCYRKAEFLFTRLTASMSQFRDWIALGSVNLDDLVDVHCREISDYENNFRALKRRGRSVEDLPNEIKIDCFSVSCVPVKNAIEQILQNLFDSLINCLRRSVQADLVAADAFLSDALEKLSARPQTVEEMTESSAKHSALAKGLTRLADQLNCAEAKDKLLRNVAGSGVGAFAATKAKWDKFQLMMESFKLMMSEQMGVLKASVESRVKSFLGSLEKFSARWEHVKPTPELLHSGDSKRCLAAVDVIRTRKTEFEEIEITMSALIRDCSHFDISPPDLSLANELKSNFAEMESMWSVYERFALEIEEHAKEDWISFRTRLYVFEEFLMKWTDLLRSEQATSMTARLMKETDQYKELLPVLKWVRGESLSPDHWIELFRLVALPRGTRLEALTFGDILSVSPHIIAQADALKNLTQRAQAEVIVREALQELDVWGAGAVFSLTPYTDCKGRDMKLIKDWKDIVTQVGDNQALLASLQGSPYFGSFADRANAWEQRLAELDAGLTGLQAVQRRWVYLEPIFGGGALTVEAPRFSKVDSEFRSLLAGIEADNRVVSITAGRREHELRNVLTNMHDQLNRCQRALNAFLEEKRHLFPRFYFIGDDDLLEILGQAANPTVIQNHLRKLFQAIHSVKLNAGNGADGGCKPNQLSITSFCSPDGEVVHLNAPVVVVSEVERWLEKLESEMRSTLSNMLSDALGDQTNASDYAGQILALREAIHFATKVEKAISTGRLSQLQRDLQANLKSYADVNMKCHLKKSSEGEEDYSNTISRVSSAKLTTLILDTGHNIDVLAYLIKQTTTSVHDWAWQKQLRFYPPRPAEASRSPQIRMVDTEFLYTFEYQGNSPRLVHTPLTDKCYLTLTQAMRMGLGGNPYGPAGTGKTESVKQLGALFGRQVIVFNCDEGIDVQSMGRIFVGLVKCGAWGCFDEFNRLEEAVLSAVSTQIQVIQNGLRSGLSHVELLGTSVNLNPNTGIFITMNPAGKGYGGRQKLPDNLKQLFRPVAMTKPDNELIAETILFSQGFTNGRVLGKKLVTIFELSRQLLSVQQHYDWGLRALKSVLKNAGAILHLSKTNESSDLDSLTAETRLLIQAVRTCSLAKLTYADAARFDALLHDVFPDSKHHASTENDSFTLKLRETLFKVFEQNNLEKIDRQILKALEVFSLLTQRMGVVIVGPSGCGKSTVLRVLWLALQQLGVPVQRYIFNPKAMSRAHLLGRTDPDTREWTDGVLTRSARDVVREAGDKKSWIVCDGDIDPEWVESLNSVLDDNRLLTLPSGERIQFGGNINFVFETHELACASPATVSRMGVVFISDEMLDPKALVNAWLQKQPEEDRPHLENLINPAYYTCLEWLRCKDECLIGTSYAGTIFNGLSHLVGATNSAKFTVGLIRGFGANLPDASRAQLAALVYQTMGESPPDPSRPINVRVDPETGNRLVPYPNGIHLVHQESLTACDTNLFDLNLTDPDQDSSGFDVNTLKPPLVITQHTRCAIDSFRAWLDDPRSQQSFLLIGPEGCGKSLLLECCLAASKRKAQVAVVQCAAQTRPSHILDKLTQCCITVTSSNPNGASRVLRPKEGDRLVLFLRDLNLPKPDKWGSCQVTAFLQQILTYKGYYDAANLEFIGVEGIQVVATLTPSSTSGGIGRYPLTPRLTSVLRIASMVSPDREELIRIYYCLLQRIANKVAGSSENLATNKSGNMEDRSRLHALASTMVHAWFQLEQTFRANKFPHCTFSLRDLTRWVVGMLRYDITSDAIAGNLWIPFGYEGRRLFRDRLPGEEPRNNFDKLFSNLLHSGAEGEADFGDWNLSSKTLNEATMASRFATGDPILVDLNDEEDARSLQKGQHWFVSWGSKESCAPGAHPPTRGRPLSLISYANLHRLATSGLKQLEREAYSKAGELVLFPDFLDLVARIDRVLSRPHGCLLLAGRCGIGRKSALRLVAHLHQITIFDLRVGKDYSKRNFANDLKAACQSAGVEAVPTILLIEDHKLTQDSFIETINSILACGEAPGLINAEDLDAMSISAGEGSSLREAAAEAGYNGALMNFFTKRVHANLHVVVLLNIDDTESLVARLLANPSLYKYCEVSWLDKWTPASQFLLPQLLVTSISSNRHKNVFSRACQAIHSATPHPRLTAPRRFVSLCSTYESLEKYHRRLLESKVLRFKTGLAKLDEARQHVNQLKMSAVERGQLLSEKQAEADKALAQISTAMQGAGKQRAEMQELQKRSAIEASSLEKRKAAIDVELAEIGPVLREAQSAVGSIRPEALSEIRALRAPPDVIRDILEGVLLLMGVRDTSWVSMRSFLARRGIQEDIRNFDARKISPDVRRMVETSLKKNADSFNPKAARRASVAAAPLAAWVHANVQFAKVIEKIAPLEREQASLKRSLEDTQRQMQQLAQDLSTVDTRVAELRRIFEDHTKATADLQIELSKANKTLAVAENLVTELEGEHTRWDRQVVSITQQLEALPAIAIISAGFITYLSACSEEVRLSTLTNWWQQLEALGLKLPPDGSIRGGIFDLKRFLVSEKEQLLWKSQGLPSDQLSIENAAVILQSDLCPFIVDPSRRAISWLTSHLKDQQIEITDQQSPNFVTVLELAVRFGKVLIIQEVDQIEPILFPLLKKDLSLQGPRATVKLGEKDVDYNENFRLFITTRQPSVSTGAVRPECAASLVSVVNFQTTRAGLMGQLLEVSLQHERPELESRRLELLKGEEEKKLELAQLEDQLLEELANARGNILENTSLLESLNKTKSSSITVAQSLAEFERLQAELENERKEFRHLAEGGSRVFFALKDLRKINPIYQFSLNSFLGLFRRALATSQDPTTPMEKKLAFLLKRLETLIVEHVSRALFKSDRLMFVMHLTHCLRPHEVPDSEWKFFTCGPSSDCKVDTEALPSWIPVDRTISMCNLRAGQMDLYEKLHFTNADLWSRWMNSEDAEEGRLPPALENVPLSGFQVLLVLQALRPTELQRAMKQFAKKTLCLPHLSPSTSSLQRLFSSDTSATEPILIVMSPGADPSHELAEAAGKQINYREVAMGQGQAEIALAEISAAAKAGDWVCLKNLHLVTYWLPVLEKHINSIVQSPNALNPNFRLWLTTEPHNGLPSTLLQTCLKLAYEAPPGLRNNLKRTYETWNSEYLARGSSVTRSTALCGLAWLHAIVQERRGFIPQGWSKFYEFSFVDVRAAANIFDRLFFDATNNASKCMSNVWATIKGLLSNTIYGGRMDNDFDVKVLESFLNQIFSDTALQNLKLGSLNLPNTTNVGDYVVAFDQLSDIDSPCDLGLPANIGKTAQRAAAFGVITQLRALQRITGSSAQGDRSLWSKELGPVLVLWKKLNQDGALIPNKDGRVRALVTKIENESIRNTKESPTLSFLQREMSNALGLISSIHYNLGAVSKLLRGTLVLTQELDAIVQSLLRGETPAAWHEKWSTGPEDYSSFCSSLITKAQALVKWLLRAEASSQFLSSDDTLNLADLLNPSIFLNAFRQQTARQLNVAIDQLRLTSNWPRNNRGVEHSLGGLAITIGHLQLEGAMFEEGRLTACHATSPTSTTLPDIQIAWKPHEFGESLGADESIELPVYFNGSRTNLVTKLRAPCFPGSQSKWIQTATALFLKNP